ncbi:MAG: DUF4241 domain-containing protein [Clostridiales bacterium]|nr:DUF4241 domain-containing protein [Clostridiales bacterium]
MSIDIKQSWIEHWNKHKDKLIPCTDLNAYFSQGFIGDIEVKQLDIGKISLYDGDLYISDPLGYLEKDSLPYFQEVPSGDFPVSICVALPKNDSHRYAALKIQFTNESAVRFEETLIGNEDISEIETFTKGEFFGYNTISGLVCICDSETKEAYCNFREKWEFDNQELNFYTDYLMNIFHNSYRENPLYQRPEGEWAFFQIPFTNNKILIVQSGYGDGGYPAYFGFDKDGRICCVILHFIDIEYECK